MNLFHPLAHLAWKAAQGIEGALRRRCERVARRCQLKVSGPADDPLMLRYRVFVRDGWELWLHNVCREDRDPHCHSHPFARGWSLVLAGWFAEEHAAEAERRGKPRCEEPDCWHCRRSRVWRYPGTLYRITPDTRHRFADVSNLGAWTLFLNTPRDHGWGFLVNGAIVPRAAYEAMRARGEL